MEKCTFPREMYILGKCTFPGNVHFGKMYIPVRIGMHILEDCQRAVIPPPPLEDVTHAKMYIPERNVYIPERNVHFGEMYIPGEMYIRERTHSSNVHI